MNAFIASPFRPNDGIPSDLTKMSASNPTIHLSPSAPFKSTFLRLDATLMKNLNKSRKRRRRERERERSLNRASRERGASERATVPLRSLLPLRLPSSYLAC